MKNLRTVTALTAMGAVIGLAAPAGAASHHAPQHATAHTNTTPDNGNAEDTPDNGNAPGANPGPHDVRDPKSQRGIIKLTACSAGLVRFENTPPTGPAMMLTNGHCMSRQFPKYGEVVVDQPSRLRGQLLDDNSKEVMPISAKRVVYGTMTYTDAAIVELNQTYEDIKNRTGIDPLVIAPRKPAVGDALTVNSGYWKTTYTCPMVKEVHKLVEGKYLTKEAVKYRDRCGTKAGTSGSPVLDDKTGEVVAVNNTGSEDGARCTSMNPCEIDENGEVFYKKGTNYGTQTAWFTTCLTDEGRIDITVEGCTLPKPGEDFEPPTVPGGENQRPGRPGRPGRPHWPGWPGGGRADQWATPFTAGPAGHPVAF